LEEKKPEEKPRKQADKYSTLLYHTDLTPLLTWEENTLILQSRRDHTMTNTCPTRITMYITGTSLTESLSTLVAGIKKEGTHTAQKLRDHEKEMQSKKYVNDYNRHFETLRVEEKITDEIEGNIENQQLRKSPYISKIDLQHTLSIMGLHESTSKALLESIDKALVNIKESDSPMLRDIITTSKLQQIKRTLIPQAVIMVHDKNPGEITEECPMRYYLRMKNELYDITTNNNNETKNKAFVRIKKSETEVIRSMKDEYEAKKLNEIHKWTKGALPKAYCNVKDKDKQIKTNLCVPQSPNQEYTKTHQ
jgi:hypothetical protein